MHRCEVPHGGSGARSRTGGSVREDAQRTVRLRVGNSLDLSQLPIRCERLKTPGNATREQFARVIGGGVFRWADRRGRRAASTRDQRDARLQKYGQKPNSWLIEKQYVGRRRSSILVAGFMPDLLPCLKLHWHRTTPSGRPLNRVLAKRRSIDPVRSPLLDTRPRRRDVWPARSLRRLRGKRRPC